MIQVDQEKLRNRAIGHRDAVVVDIDHVIDQPGINLQIAAVNGGKDGRIGNVDEGFQFAGTHDQRGYQPDALVDQIIGDGTGIKAGNGGQIFGRKDTERNRLEYAVETERVHEITSIFCPYYKREQMFFQAKRRTLIVKRQPGKTGVCGRPEGGANPN